VGRTRHIALALGGSVVVGLLVSTLGGASAAPQGTSPAALAHRQWWSAAVLGSPTTGARTSSTSAAQGPDGLVEQRAVPRTGRGIVPPRPRPTDGAVPVPERGGLPGATAGPTAGASATAAPSPTGGATSHPAPGSTTTPRPAPTSQPAPSTSPTVKPAPKPTSPAPEPAPTTSAPVGSWPGAATTGVPDGVTLTASKSLRVTKDGTVLSGLDVSGDISIEADDVVVRNTRIRGTGTYGILVRSGSVLVEDVEIVGPENAIAGDDWTARRVDIHGTTGDGVKVGSDVTLEDSWIHDLTPARGAHADGVQMQSGVRNLVVRHNRIDVSAAGSANSAIFLAPDLGPSAPGPVLVVQNYLDGGGYTLFCVDGADGRYVVDDITIRDNTFGGGAEYGAARVNVPVTWSGNVYAGGGSVRY